MGLGKWGARMAKVKVTSRFKILELIDGFLDGTTVNAIGNTIVKQAKELIASGQSPVRGYGRFQVYSDSYKKQIRGAYGRNLDKSVRPVNLTATGLMLDGYTFRQKGRESIEVGVMKGNHAKLAVYHNDGTDKMPARPIVPEKDEEFSTSIMRDVRDKYGERLRKLISESNKK